MRIHSYALSIVLGAANLPQSTNAFLHSPPRSSSLSTRNNRSVQHQSTSLAGESSGSSSIISQLAFYPSDETLSERLKNVQAEFNNVKKDGIGKFFADELEAAERIIQGNAADAEKGANDVIEKGEGDYLLKEGFHSMADAGKKLANEIWEVKQEFDELKAAKIVEEAAEDVVSTDVLVERDLEKVVENVVSSLEEAEEAVKAAIATVASKEGLTDSAKAEITEKLEQKAQNIEESIKVADSVAKTAKQIAVEDEKIMSELEKTGDRLSAAIDATESLTAKLKGTEGGEVLDAVSKTVDQTASIVKEDLSAAESIADAVGQKVVMEAEAVMAMDNKAADSVKSVRAAKTSIEESSGGDESNEALKEALTKDANDIKLDSTTAEKLAKAIEQDATNDEDALKALESSSKEVNELIDAVDGAVKKAEDSMSGEASESSVTEAVEKIEEEVEQVEGSVTEVEKAAEECEDCKVKEVKKEIEEVKDSDKEDVKAESKESEVKEEKEEESDSDSDGESDSDSEGESDSDSDGESDSDSEDEKENENENKKEESESESKKVDDAESKHEGEKDVEVSSSDVEEKEELLAQNEQSPAIEEPVGEDLAEETITTASTDTSMNLESDAEVTGKLSEDVTTLAAADHDGEVLGNAVASTTADSSHATSNLMADATENAMHSISGEDLADALANTNPPEGMGTVVASAASAASELGESISASAGDAMHDVSTSTTEALAEAVAVVSSLFM